MKTPDRKQLLNDILAGEELEVFRQSTVAVGIAALQQRNRSRRFARHLAAVVPVLVAGALLWLLLEPKRPGLRTQIPSPKPSYSSETPAGIRTISDDELLALFPDRGVALIGKPGNQRLILFDRQPL